MSGNARPHAAWTVMPVIRRIGAGPAPAAGRIRPRPPDVVATMRRSGARRLVGHQSKAKGLARSIRQAFSGPLDGSDATGLPWTRPSNRSEWRTSGLSSADRTACAVPLPRSAFPPETSTSGRLRPPHFPVAGRCSRTPPECLVRSLLHRPSDDNRPISTMPSPASTPNTTSACGGGFSG